MEFKNHENGIIEIIDDNRCIINADDLFSILLNNECSTIIIKEENISQDFFNLSTGMAGEILQKFSNYHKRMAIIGKFDCIKNKPLIDFIYESNRTKKIIFVNKIEEAIKIFNE